MSGIPIEPSNSFRAIYLAPGVLEAVALSYTPHLTFRADGLQAVTLRDGSGIPNPGETYAAIAVIRLLRHGLVIIETATALFILPESDLPNRCSATSISRSIYPNKTALQ